MGCVPSTCILYPMYMGGCPTPPPPGCRPPNTNPYPLRCSALSLPRCNPFLSDTNHLLCDQWCMLGSPDEQTNMSKNITLSQLRLRPIKMAVKGSNIDFMFLFVLFGRCIRYCEYATFLCSDPHSICVTRINTVFFTGDGQDDTNYGT